MSRDEWIAAFAAAVGGDPPTTEEIEALLGLAAVAAHASERTAAPLTCFLVGRAGITMAEAERLAADIAGGGP